MNARSVVGVALLVSAAGLFGCAPPRTRFISPRDQACAEAGLMGPIDPSLEKTGFLREAFERFDAGCKGGDPIACGLLGIMAERGLSIEPSPDLAMELYGRACRIGNKNACKYAARVASQRSTTANPAGQVAFSLWNTPLSAR